MKKKIIIISVVLMGFVLAVTANSWAQRERGGNRPMHRGGNFQTGEAPSIPEFNRDRGRPYHKWDKPAVHKFNRDRGRAYHPRRSHHRPVHRFKPEFHKRHHYRAPHRFGPRFRHWRHRPAYRHWPAKPFFRRHQHSVINQVTNYYSNAESDTAPQDEFHASATVSNTGFSVTVGASKTN
jgi:hypothetical protein